MKFKNIYWVDKFGRLFFLIYSVVWSKIFGQKVFIHFVIWIWSNGPVSINIDKMWLVFSNFPLIILPSDPIWKSLQLITLWMQSQWFQQLIQNSGGNALLGFDFKMVLFQSKINNLFRFDNFDVMVVLSRKLL